MKAFAEAGVRTFERTFVSEIRIQFPKTFGQFGEPGILRLLHLAETRCASHKITSSQGIRTWARLMLAFGREFDTEEGWAAKVLGDPVLNSEAAKLVALFAAATKAAAVMAKGYKGRGRHSKQARGSRGDWENARQRESKASRFGPARMSRVSVKGALRHCGRPWRRVERMLLQNKRIRLK